MEISNLDMRKFLSITNAPALSIVPALVLALSFSIAPSLSAGAPAHTGGLLVIDQGADLAQDAMRENLFEIIAERDGQAGVDDNGDGLIDNVSGWNLPSQNAEYMPLRFIKFFTDFHEVLTQVFAIYSRLEAGDKSALDELRSEPEILKLLSHATDMSHGTHVAGIAAKEAGPGALIHNLNVFSEADPKAPSGYLQRARLLSGVSVAVRIIGDAVNLQSAPPVLTLDNPEKLAEIIKQAQEAETSFVATLDAYLSGTQPSVVNLSLGTSKQNILESLAQLHFSECAQFKLDSKACALTDARKTQLINFVNAIFNQTKNSWETIFAKHIQTLFIIAAGNDGLAAVPVRGDLRRFEVTPASSARNFSNVLTVAATNDQGQLTEFSCYSPDHVDIGAPGLAIESLSPRGILFRMSGTSMAAPMVAGTALRMRMIAPHATPLQIKTMIVETGDEHPSLAGKTISGKFLNSRVATDAARLLADGMTPEDALELSSSRRPLRLQQFTQEDSETALVPELVRELIRGRF